MDKQARLMIPFKSVILLILQAGAIVILVGSQVPERKGGIASCHLRELELCSLGAVSMFQNPNGIPISSNEFTRQCEYLHESGECFQDYRDNCLTKLQSNLFNSIELDFGNFGEEFCKNGTKINSIYMKHASCLRDVQKKYQRTCLADLQVGFEAIHKIPHNIRFPTACCNLNKLKDCLMPRIEESCGQEALEFVEDLLRRAIGRAFHITCRGFEPTSSRCKELLPKLNQKPYNGRNTSAISRAISSYANAHTM